MRKTITTIVILTIIFILNPAYSLAQGLGCGEGFGGIAKIFCPANKTLDKDAASQQAGIQLNKIVSTIIGVLTVVAAIWFIFQFIIAGFQWIQSGGEKNNLEQARDKITNALIGLIIVVSAWIIMGVIGKILGLEILNPGSILQNLGK